MKNTQKNIYKNKMNKEIIDAIKSNNINNLKTIFLVHSNLISTKNDDHETLLHIACINNSIESLKFLLVLGGKKLINLQDKSGKTALHQACFNVNEDIVDLLIDNGADINIFDHKNLSCIYQTVIRRNQDDDFNIRGESYRICEKLIELKIDIDMTQKPTSFLATKFRIQNIYKLLERYEKQYMQLDRNPKFANTIEFFDEQFSKLEYHELEIGSIFMYDWRTTDGNVLSGKNEIIRAYLDKAIINLFDHYDHPKNPFTNAEWNDVSVFKYFVLTPELMKTLNAKVSYKNKKYTIRVGNKGGKYILVGADKKKIYLKRR